MWFVLSLDNTNNNHICNQIHVTLSQTTYTNSIIPFSHHVSRRDRFCHMMDLESRSFVYYIRYQSQVELLCLIRGHVTEKSLRSRFTSDVSMSKMNAPIILSTHVKYHNFLWCWSVISTSKSCCPYSNGIKCEKFCSCCNNLFFHDTAVVLCLTLMSVV